MLTPVAWRYFRPHGLGRRDADRATHRRLRASRGGDQAREHRGDANACRQVVIEIREPEELVVQADHGRTEPRADQHAGERRRPGR